jgi:hypothetical protein
MASLPIRSGIRGENEVYLRPLCALLPRGFQSRQIGRSLPFIYSTKVFPVLHRLPGLTAWAQRTTFECRVSHSHSGTCSLLSNHKVDLEILRLISVSLELRPFVREIVYYDVFDHKHFYVTVESVDYIFHRRKPMVFEDNGMDIRHL